MPDNTQLINFEAVVASAVDTGSVQQSLQAIKNEFKGLTVPISPKMDKAAYSKAARDIANHVKKTGNTDVRFSVDSKDVKTAQSELNTLTQRYKAFKKIEDSSKHTVSSRQTFEDDIMKQARERYVAASKRDYSGPSVYKDIYTNADAQYKSLHGRSKNAISFNEFRDKLFSAQLASDNITSIGKEIDRLTSQENWKNNPQYVQKLKELTSDLSYNKSYLNTMSQSTMFKDIVAGMGLNIGSDTVSQEMLRSISTEFSKMSTSAAQERMSKEQELQSLMSKYIDEARSQLEREMGVKFDPKEGLVSIDKDEEITYQRYNANRRKLESLYQKSSKGEALSEEEKKAVRESAQIVKNGPTDKTRQVQELPEKLSNFMKIALNEAESLGNFVIPDNLKNLDVGNLKSAREYLSSFYQKVQMDAEITAEEYKSAQDALKTFDSYHQSRKEKRQADIDAEIAERGKTRLDPYQYQESEYVKNVREYLKNTSPPKQTSTDVNKVVGSDLAGGVNVPVKVDTSSVESALMDIRELTAKDNIAVDINFLAHTESIENALRDIHELTSKDNLNIDINFLAHTESIESSLRDLHELSAKDNANVGINFKVDGDGIDQVVQQINELKTKDSNESINLIVNTSSIDEALVKLEKLKPGDKTIDYTIKVNSTSALDDFIALESIAAELQNKMKFTARVDTGRSFSEQKVNVIESMATKMEQLTKSGSAYGARMTSSFSNVGKSVSSLISLVDKLNAKFNLSGDIASGLKSMNQMLGNRSPLRQSNTGSSGAASGGANIDSRIQNLFTTAEKKSVTRIDLDSYTQEYKNRVETIMNQISDLKDKYSSGGFVDDSEIESDIASLKRLNQELTDLGRTQNKYRLQNNQGNVIGTEVGLEDFTETRIQEMFESNNDRLRILETKLGKNGTSATVKARSRADGKLETHSVNLDLDTGVARQQLKARSDYKSLFGQITNELGQEVTKLSKYLISMGGIDFAWTGLQQGIESIREMNTALTELKKVTNETDEVYSKVQQNMFSTGEEIGRDAVELTKSTADWARLGYDIPDAQNLSKWTGILMNVSEFENVDDATNSLISIMQGFGKGADDIENVVDVLNNIGNKFPISSDEIASSLQRSASALKAGGNDYYKSVALTTVGDSVVQDPASVGAGLKVIGLRLRGTDTKTLQEAGEDTDGVVTSVSQLRQLILDLTKVSSNDFKGFDMLKDDGSYKDTYDVLLGIGKIWKEIGEQEGGDLKQASILEKLAGKNRANIVASILQNPEMLQQVYAETKNSEGSALQENATYLDSIQGKVDQLTASLQEMWNNSINSEAIKGLVDFGTGLTNLIDQVGLLNTAFAGAAVVAGSKGKLGRANYQLSSKMQCPEQSDSNMERICIEMVIQIRDCLENNRNWHFCAAF